MQTAQDTRQRFCHSGSLKTHASRNLKHVGFDDATRNTNVLRVCAVVEEQVFAQVFLVLAAIETFPARSGIQRNYAHTALELLYSRPNFFNNAREFVSEQSR